VLLLSFGSRHEVHEVPPLKLFPRAAFEETSSARGAVVLVTGSPQNVVEYSAENMKTFIVYSLRKIGAK